MRAADALIGPMAGARNSIPRRRRRVSTLIPPSIKTRVERLASWIACLAGCRPIQETEFRAQRLTTQFARKTPKCLLVSVGRPEFKTLTLGNAEAFRQVGNRCGLPGLHGGGCRNRTVGLFAMDYWYLSKRRSDSIASANDLWPRRHNRQRQKSRSDRQKGLDFQREESVSVLAGERRV